MDFGIFTQEDVSRYYRKAKQYISQARKQRKFISPYYGRLVNTLKDLYPQQYNLVNKKIQALYEKDIFILKR
ncbi:hypothetical protein KKG31_08625 [Patescibacteria group bacterium]|nr:hypothetical protein [Patescibacteria group bacterium]MBU1759118.1 hypothetical protein [Patescibacteria group bacterium]